MAKAARTASASSAIYESIDERPYRHPKPKSHVRDSLAEKIVWSILPSLYIAVGFQEPWRFPVTDVRFIAAALPIVMVAVPITFVIALASHAWLVFINLSVFEHRNLQRIIGASSLAVAIAATAHVMAWYENYLKTANLDGFDGVGNIVIIVGWVIAFELALLVGLLVARAIVAMRGTNKA
jgi:hypothetical protein